jgi:hypothetical protein
VRKDHLTNYMNGKLKSDCDVFCFVVESQTGERFSTRTGSVSERDDNFLWAEEFGELF